MEGVLVSAKKEGSTITTTVVTQRQGRSSASRPAGSSPASTRSRSAPPATCSSGPKTVDIGAGAPRPPTSSSTRPGTWRASSPTANGCSARPGDDQIKVVPARLRRAATRCSASSPRCTTPDEWKQVFTRMGRYAPESMPTHPQLIVPAAPRSERPRVPATMMEQAADYLTSVSLEQSGPRGIRPQDAAAPEGQRHQGHHHRIRPAAQGSAAA